METSSGEINSDVLLDSIRSAPRTSIQTESTVDDVDPEAPSRRILTYIVCMLLIGFILSINFMAALLPQDPPDNKGNDLDGMIPINSAFSTYYKGRYELCQDADKIQLNDGTIKDRPKKCWMGDMDITMLFKEVAIDSYVKVYLIFSLDVPYNGPWWKFWRSIDEFSTNKRNGRLYFGLSGLEYNREVGHLLLSGITPSICPTRPKGIFKEYWAKNAIKQSKWNEFGNKGPICSCNAYVNYPIPNSNQISFREQDDFYFMGLRKYVFTDFEHVADLDFSIFNPFNAFRNDDLNNDYKYSRGIVEGSGEVVGSGGINGGGGSTKDVNNGGSGDGGSVRDVNNAVDHDYNSSSSSTTPPTSSLELPPPSSTLPSSTPHPPPSPSLPIGGEFYSKECGFSMRFNGNERDMKEFEGLLFRFSLIFIIKSFIECLLLCHQFKCIDEEAQGQSISIISLSMLSYQEVLEVFLLLYHGSVYQNALIYFGMMMFIKFFY